MNDDQGGSPPVSGWTAPVETIAPSSVGGGLVPESVCRLGLPTTVSYVVSSVTSAGVLIPLDVLVEGWPSHAAVMQIGIAVLRHAWSSGSGRPCSVRINVLHGDLRNVSVGEPSSECNGDRGGVERTASANKVSRVQVGERKQGCLDRCRICVERDVARLLTIEG